jgi:hypothetical protein
MAISLSTGTAAVLLATENWLHAPFPAGLVLTAVRP